MNLKSQTSEFNKLQIGLTAGSHFIIDIYQSFYIGLIPIIAYKFGLSLFQVSLLGAMGVIANSVFAPVFGYMSDRYGVKYFIVAGPLVTSIFLSTLGVVPNYWVFLLILFGGNLGLASYHPASASMAGHHGGKHKGLGTSLISFGGHLGNAFGSLVIILIIQKIGIEYSPLLMIPGIITSLILSRLIPFKQSSITAGKEHDFFTRLKKITRKKIYLTFVLVFSVYSILILWISLINYMPLYFTKANIPLINIGIIIFLFGIVGGGGGFLFGYLYDRYKKGNVLIQVELIISMLLVFFIFQLEGTAAIIIFILSGFFLISGPQVCIRILQDMFPKNMSLASSLIFGGSSGLAGITIIFLGKAADIIGIARLIRFELLFLLVAFLFLFTYPYIEKK